MNQWQSPITLVQRFNIYRIEAQEEQVNKNAAAKNILKNNDQWEQRAPGLWFLNTIFQWKEPGLLEKGLILGLVQEK